METALQKKSRETVEELHSRTILVGASRAVVYRAAERIEVHEHVGVGRRRAYHRGGALSSALFYRAGLARP